MVRRLVFPILVVTGLGMLVIGSLEGSWSRIHYFSVQICLSCMGLV